MFDLLMVGLQSVTNPYTLSFILLGTAAGILVGCIPGFGSTMAMVLCLPFTFGMSSINGMAMMLGVMAGGCPAAWFRRFFLAFPARRERW